MAEATQEGEAREPVGPAVAAPEAPIPADAWVRIHLAHPVHRGVEIDIVDTMVELAESGHHEAGHGNRVALIAERIAAVVDPALATGAFRAGLLHDIGKALLPFHPGAMPRRLSRIERTVVDRHPELGADLARWAGERPDVVAAVHSHHERVDGSGYPAGQRGAAVPLLGQIVAAADVMEALRSRRSYKPAWSINAIGAYFRAHRRGWLMPRVWAAAMEELSDDGQPASTPDVEA